MGRYCLYLFESVEKQILSFGPASNLFEQERNAGVEIRQAGQAEGVGGSRLDFFRVGAEVLQESRTQAADCAQVPGEKPLRSVANCHDSRR